MTDDAVTANPERPFTLAIDVGGTGIKASVLDASGRMVADRVRVDTTYPLSPERFIATISELARPLPRADRVSVGFPGVVRHDRIITAPHFVTVHGPETEVDPELFAAWSGFAIGARLAAALDAPTKVSNDADLQGLAVVKGDGIELVVTLGTGVGTALFRDGVLAPHIDISHHPLAKGETYNQRIGEAAYARIGVKRWRRRVVHALQTLDGMINFDHCYVGGGNSRHLVGRLGERFEIVDNVAGILGGIKLWEGDQVPSG